MAEFSEIMSPDDNERDRTASADLEFERQKTAFQRIPRSVLRRYKGQYVVAHNGQIVDHDANLTVLGQRFFDSHGDIAVYITRVDKTKPVKIRTPFLRHK
jgi:hypothetical protein